MGLRSIVLRGIILLYGRTSVVGLRGIMIPAVLRYSSEGRCISIRKGSEKIIVKSVCEQIGFAVAAINNHLSYEALKNLQHA